MHLDAASMAVLLYWVVCGLAAASLLNNFHKHMGAVGALIAGSAGYDMGWHAAAQKYASGTSGVPVEWLGPYRCALGLAGFLIVAFAVYLATHRWAHPVETPQV